MNGEVNYEIFGMQGSINKVIWKKVGDGFGGFVTYSNIVTSSGQSGSPLQVVVGDKVEIIGVHNGDLQIEGSNVGTIIT